MIVAPNLLGLRVTIRRSILSGTQEANGKQGRIAAVRWAKGTTGSKSHHVKFLVWCPGVGFVLARHEEIEPTGHFQPAGFPGSSIPQGIPGAEGEEVLMPPVNLAGVKKPADAEGE